MDGPLSAISWRHAADMRACRYDAGDGLLTAVDIESDGTLYRLVVQRLPNGAAGMEHLANRRTARELSVWRYAR